jgi:hypothetical protein
MSMKATAEECPFSKPSSTKETSWCKAISVGDRSGGSGNLFPYFRVEVEEKFGSASASLVGLRPPF